jgi:hypothetical protein
MHYETIAKTFRELEAQGFYIPAVVMDALCKLFLDDNDKFKEKLFRERVMNK